MGMQGLKEAGSAPGQLLLPSLCREGCGHRMYSNNQGIGCEGGGGWGPF